jgi:hypothetical protein
LKGKMVNLKRQRGILYTYTGKISFPDGAPNIQDIAVSLGRECRYAGAGVRWWPVALHTFAVCDLLPPELKLHGLLHDSPECITGDVPKPVKTEQIESLELHLLKAIYKGFHLCLPTAAQHRIIKRADEAVLCGEVYTVGTRALQDEYPRSPKAEKLVMKYLAQYPPMECITPDGRAPIEFVRRFRVYSDLLAKSGKPE